MTVLSCASTFYNSVLMDGGLSSGGGPGHLGNASNGMQIRSPCEMIPDIIATPINNTKATMLTDMKMNQVQDTSTNIMGMKGR